MQNKSYDRYVELLRAAEVQQYERTSARFVATLGTATTSSWLARNPITSLLSSVCSVLIIAVAAYMVVTNEQTVEPFQMQTKASAFALNDDVAPSLTNDVAHVSRTRSIDVDPRSRTIEEATVPEEPAIGMSSTAEENIESANDSQLSDMITLVHVITQPELLKLGSNEVQSLRMISFESSRVDRVPHSWSISLAAQDLAAVVSTKRLDFRATALLESGQGFSLGIAVGKRGRSERSSEFAGFIDTVLIVNDREYSSKIGQYRVIESESSFLEAGIAASYQFYGDSDEARFRPELSVFAGIEGKTVVLEQSIGINWKLGDRFSILGGVSLREYPAIDLEPRLCPQVGLRTVF